MSAPRLSAVICGCWRGLGIDREWARRLVVWTSGRCGTLVAVPCVPVCRRYTAEGWLGPPLSAVGLGWCGDYWGAKAPRLGSFATVVATVLVVAVAFEVVAVGRTRLKLSAGALSKTMGAVYQAAPALCAWAL